MSKHKRKITKFPRRKWITPGPYHTICADLIDYQQYFRQNGGARYILVVIDAFSRFAYTRALRSKKAEETANAIEDIIQSMAYPPTIFISDQGGEFDLRNKYFSSLINKYHLAVYYAKGVTKNAIVERWNRTIETRFERYFTEQKNHRWVDVLKDFTNNINHTKNRSIGMPPASVNLDNSQVIFQKLHPDIKRPKDCKLKIGDIVRLAIQGNIFTKVIQHLNFETLMELLIPC